MKKSAMQFTRPCLEKVDFKINTNYDANEDGVNIDINAHVNVRRSTEESEVAKVSLNVKIFDKEEMEVSNMIPFYLMVEYSANFSWDSSMEDDIEILLNQNAPAILLSYVRALIVNLTANSEFPPLHIPLMNFTEDEVVE